MEACYARALERQDAMKQQGKGCIRRGKVMDEHGKMAAMLLARQHQLDCMGKDSFRCSFRCAHMTCCQFRLPPVCADDRSATRSITLLHRILHSSAQCSLYIPHSVPSALIPLISSLRRLRGTYIVSTLHRTLCVSPRYPNARLCSPNSRANSLLGVISVEEPRRHVVLI